MASDKGQALAFIFSTHRGRKVRRWAWGLAGASFALSVFNGAVNPGEEASSQDVGDQSTSVADAGTEDAGTDKIKVAKADPFATDEPEAITISDSEPEEQGLLQEAAIVAGSGIERYATYAHDQTAQDYVKLIPGLAPSASKVLLEAAETNWVEVKSERIKATTKLRSPQPQVTAYNGNKGTAKVAVAVTQKVRSGDETTTFNRSYTVNLKRVEDEQRGWQITAFVSN